MREDVRSIDPGGPAVTASIRRLLAAPAVVVALAATGCSSTTTGAIAARVGTETISTAQLAELTEAAQRSGELDELQGAERADWQRRAMQSLITTRVLRLVAADKGVAVSPEDIARAGEQRRAAAGATGEAPQPSVLADQEAEAFALLDALLQEIAPVTDEQVAAEYEKNKANFERVNLVYFQVATKREADRLAAQGRANVAGFEELARAQVGDDPAAQIETGLQGRQTFAQSGEPVVEQIFGAREGEVIVITLPEPQGFVVGLVKERQVTPLDEVRAQLISQLRSPEARADLEATIQDTLKSARVTVNPRFGKWDDNRVTELLTPTVKKTEPKPAGGGLPGGDGQAPVDPSQIDPSQIDPSQIDPSQIDPSQIDPSQVDPSQVDPSQVDPSQIDPSQLEPGQEIPADPEAPAEDAGTS